MVRWNKWGWVGQCPPLWTLLAPRAPGEPPGTWVFGEILTFWLGLLLQCCDRLCQLHQQTPAPKNPVFKGSWKCGNKLPGYTHQILYCSIHVDYWRTRCVCLRNSSVLACFSFLASQYYIIAYLYSFKRLLWPILCLCTQHAAMFVYPFLATARSLCSACLWTGF